MKLTSDKGVAHDSQLAGITQSNVLRLAISHLTIDQTCRRSLDALHGTQQKFNLVMGHCCFWRTFRFVSTGVSRTLCTKCKGWGSEFRAPQFGSKVCRAFAISSLGAPALGVPSEFTQEYGHCDHVSNGT